MFEFVTGSEAETENLGRRLAGRLSSGDVIYLEGDLGAGKTCLARGIALGLRASPREIASPTFAILHEYAGEDGVIVLRHTDPKRHRPFRVGNLAVVYLVGGTGAALCVAIMYGLPGVAWVRFGVWLLIGLALYFAYGYRHSKLRKPT